ncbi:MAG: cobalamin biosynthesis protein, partial [Synechococcaceae cyanobacterium]|nr:cobalamin biosynthesis protein [Synechococcaceae cyanobacterium]
MNATGAGGIVAIGFGPGSSSLLRRLEQAGLTGETRWPPSPRTGAEDRRPPTAEPAGRWLARRWPHVRAVVAVGACGLVTRLIAPLVGDKRRDPAVLVLDPGGRFVIPLLGGHGAGGEQLCHEIAALVDARAVLTGGSSTGGRLALDAFGRAWGWRRGTGAWDGLMVKAAGPAGVAVRQACGQPLWRDLEAARNLADGGTGHPAPDELVIDAELGPGCRWHPPCLWLGVGCERNTSLSLLERLVDRTLARAGLAPEAVAALATVTRKGDEAALLRLAERRQWPLRLFPAGELARVPVPHPSERVAREVGTPSVAEAAALLGASATPTAAPRLLVPKTIERPGPGERGAATLAVALARRQWAPGRGSLHLVGSGPGSLDLLTGDARRALAEATVWV